MPSTPSDRRRAAGECRPWFHGEYVVTMQSGARVNLSRSYRQWVRAKVDSLS